MAARKKGTARARSVALTGVLYEWTDCPSENCTITPDERPEYEEKGWSVLDAPSANRPGQLIAVRTLSFMDGDIRIQQKSSWYGRDNQREGHTNYGHGGYYRSYVWIDGRRQMLLDFWKLFPSREHDFDQQGLRHQAIERIRTTVRAHRGSRLTKHKEGWKLFPNGNTATWTGNKPNASV